jgi:NADPH-dependent curcumin reductase CurA
MPTRACRNASSGCLLTNTRAQKSVTPSENTPAMRGWVSAVANYSEPVALGAVMRSGAVGRVEESRSADFHAGDCVLGMFGWQDFAVDL